MATSDPAAIVPGLSLSEYQTLSVLRAVLLGMLPAGVEVIRAEINRVPEPLGTDFVVMTPLYRSRLSTNIDTWTDETAPGALDGSGQVLAPTQVTVQLDVHGPASADNAQVISTLMQDEYAFAAFSDSGFDVRPLYVEDPRQTAFANGEQQTEQRWSIDVALQANPVVTTSPQYFFSTTTVQAISVDVP